MCGNKINGVERSPHIVRHDVIIERIHAATYHFRPLRLAA
jgi:hypothetical protein